MDRPILFSGPMVRALLDGSKTQTRRLVKPFRGFEHNHVCRPDLAADSCAVWWHGSSERIGCHQYCPNGVPGDRLWVRETWQFADWTEDGQPFVRFAADNTVRFCEGAGEGESLVDTWAELSAPENYEIDNKAADRRWRPSIFMPRWASRLTLTITDVRVERLQEISERDCEAEGVQPRHMYEGDIDERDLDPTTQGFDMFMWVESYRELWDSLNAKRAPWSSNPWVWVLTFEVARA